MLDTKVKVFHEMTLKLYFMKCLERKISQCILPFRNIDISNFADHITPYAYNESLEKVLLEKTIIEQRSYLNKMQN